MQSPTPQYTGGLYGGSGGAAPAPAGPTRPPAGYYDPALDAAERAGERGLGDFRIDTDTANSRASTDYVTGTARVGEDRDTSLAGLLRAKMRGLQDVETGRSRGLEDVGSARDDVNRQAGRSLADLARGYRERGVGQAEQIQAAGVAGGGALKAALARRTADQGREQAGAQRGFDRFSEDSVTSEGRLGEDLASGLSGLDRGATRIGEDYDTGVSGVQRGAQRALDDAGTDYQYGVDDRTLGLTRAQREQGFFSADTALQRWFQAAAAGYRPPKG